MEGRMIRNIFNSVSNDRSQTGDPSRKNVNDALTNLDGGDFAFGDNSLPAAPANVGGPISVIASADAALSSGGTVLLTSGSTTLTVGSGSGIIFKNTFDSSCTQAYINCVVAAEDAIRSQWINSITLNLDFSLEANGTNSDMEPNKASSGVNVTYAQLRTALDHLY
jgi:hypothetical protein